MEILTNSAKVTHRKPTYISGSNPLPVSLFTYYSFQIKFSSFPGKLASRNSMGKKDDTVKNTIAYRKVRKRKELESKIVPKWRFFMVERVWFAQLVISLVTN